MRSDKLTAAVALAPVVVAKGDTVRLHLDPASILGYVLVGLVVGLVARLLVPGRDPIGLIGTILIGVIGSVLGGWLAGAMFPKTTGIDWIASVVVAMVLILLLRAGSRRQTAWGGRRW